MSYQEQVKEWTHECFGEEVSNDKLERCDRFIEEVFELVQSLGYDPLRIYSLIEYVFNRDVGEPSQEVGGVMVTLAALCNAHEIDLKKSADDELARVWTKVEQIRKKQAAKPKGSALPQANLSNINDEFIALSEKTVREEVIEIIENIVGYKLEMLRANGKLSAYLDMDNSLKLFDQIEKNFNIDIYDGYSVDEIRDMIVNGVVKIIKSKTPLIFRN